MLRYAAIPIKLERAPARRSARKPSGSEPCDPRKIRSCNEVSAPPCPPARRAGGHGGADTSLHDLIFRGSQGSDPLGLRADLRAGARSSLIGIAAYRSIERGGQTVRIKEDRK